MNIVDIFPYFNEKELLELRINLLYDHVDRFIICEANRTHSGLLKEFTAKKTIKELNLPTDKITVIEHDLSEYDNSIDPIRNWKRERSQRNSAAKYILKNDICFVSDCDEIVNPLSIKYYSNVSLNNPNNILRIPLINLSNRADLEVCDMQGKTSFWTAPFVCLYHHVQIYTLSEIREAHSMKGSSFMYNDVKFSDIFAIDNGIIEPVGWHFSWMGDSDRNIKKYQSFLHFDDIIENSICTYSDQSIEEFLKKYKPKVGTTDLLGRRNFLLKSYPHEKLPNKLFQLHRVKQFLLPKTRKILFHDNQLSGRGTSISLYNYAYFGRELLNIEPIITFDKNSDRNKTELISQFQQEFKVLPYDNFSEVEKIIDQNQIDYFYAIKYGIRDNVIVTNAKNLIHSVFNYDINEIHGDIYATVSEWMAVASNYNIPYVPHIINLPQHSETLRNELNIPDTALVFGRHGGMDTFDVPFINEVIYKFLCDRKDVWFLFLNTPSVIQHERCIYLDYSADLNFKVKFINTCDAMIHGGFRGETFGLAILEFATNNKQIITFDNYVGGRNHHFLLRNNYFCYLTKQELYEIFNKINKQNPFDTMFLKDMFSPENIMKKFEQVFLK